MNDNASNKLGGDSSNLWCSDMGTCLLDTPQNNSQKLAYKRRQRPIDLKSEPVADLNWYPRVVSSYGLSESVHWSRHLIVDSETGPSGRHALQLRNRKTRRDYYGREDADAAFLQRKPFSFMILAKPGLPDDSLAGMLSAHWGSVHVSPALGLAAGRIDARTAWTLRTGRAVNAAGTAALLTRILGLNDPVVQERGYVMTGVPRHNPMLSTRKQMDAVFAMNPPDLLIYMSCADRDLSIYREGLILESLGHEHLTQTLHPTKAFDRDNHRYVRWFKSTRNRIISELDLVDFKEHSLMVVEEIIKQFDPGCVITIDGRKPVIELFDTIKAKLLTLPLRRTVLPEIVRDGNESFSSYKFFRYRSEIDEMAEFESESRWLKSLVDVEYETFEDEENENRLMAEYERVEKIRVMSEFGSLCPVNFYYGLFKLGNIIYCVKYMGKLYYFNGPEEMRLFEKFPRYFLEIPRPGMPIRAMLFGPEVLSSPVAKAVSKFFGYTLFDAKYIKTEHEKQEQREYFSSVVRSAVKVAQMIIKVKKNPSENIEIMRNAISEWIQLHFGKDIELDSLNTGVEDNESNVFDNDSDQTQKTIEKNANGMSHEHAERMVQLREFFESYGIDFINDLEACIRAHNEPEKLIKYFQNMSKQNRNAFRSNFLSENEFVGPDLYDSIVNNLKIRSRRGKNWIVVNAPLDFQLIKKMSTADLNPIQMVFFHDSDPKHEFLLGSEFSNIERNDLIRETFDNFKNGIRYDTAIKRVSYPEFIGQTSEKHLSSTSPEDDYDELENEYEYENETAEEPYYTNEQAVEIIFSHERLMEMIMPEITERLNRYTENFLGQWQTLRNYIINDSNNRYVDFNIIQCKPDSKTNMLKNMVEDTLHYIKKFLSDNVYEVTLTNSHDTIPKVGKYDGDTSIYCPVNFGNGRLLVGSKKYIAIYQNRYYYMSSPKELRAFTSFPSKYSSFTSVPKSSPRPKISLLCSYGISVPDLIKNILKTYNLTLIDSKAMFIQKVLPENMPMLGKMYEEPVLKKIFDKQFVPKILRDHVQSLRQYIDRESLYLSDKDWLKINSVFFRMGEGTCCKNYPRNLKELEYLKVNGMNPDVVIEVVANNRFEEMEEARKKVMKNWLSYQYALVDKAVAQDNVTRRNTVNNRSKSFKNKLAEIIKEKKSYNFKKRLGNVIETIAVETIYRVSNTLDYAMCDTESYTSKISDGSKNISTLCLLPNLLARYSELTLKRKKIIIDYELNVEDFLGLDDFAILEEIEKQVDEEFPETEYVISKCFANNLSKIPPNSVIEQHLEKEKIALASMRQFAKTVDIPWIILPMAKLESENFPSSALSAVSKIFVNDGSIFETTFDVNFETAESMLVAGEAYLSGFWRWCPVWLYENRNSVQPFYTDLLESRILPVVHRKYVYYLRGPQNRDKFVRKPLKYVLNADTWHPPSNIPMKIAVIGPPKSGKSYCAQWLCDRHGFQLIQIEDQVKSYLTSLWWTDDAKSTLRKLYRGDVLSDFTLVEIVKSAMQTTRAILHGFVLDGFPATEKQFTLLNESGIILHKVFVLNDSSSPAQVWPYDDMSASMFLFRHRSWMEQFVGTLWLSENFGNMDTTNDCDEMDLRIQTSIWSLRQYLKNMSENKPCNLANIAVMKDEQLDRMSMFLDSCPVCRVDDHRSTRPSPENSRTTNQNWVQYKYYFYWVCPQHQGTFIENPVKYANGAPDEPEMWPLRTTDEELLRIPYVLCKYFSEYCVVCALSSLWHPVYRRGDGQFMVKHLKRTFAFCSSKCYYEFMQRPMYYIEYTMRVRGPCEDPLKTLDGKLAIDGLPVLGYLEQTVGYPTSDALAKLIAIKPIYPGLSARVSAMVFLGLCIGENSSDEDLNEYYRKAFKRFVGVCNDFRTEVYKLKLVT